MPRLSSPPRAVSSTATSTDGSRRTMRAATGPVMSPSTVRRPSMYTPSVVATPTLCRAILKMCATMRVVVVLPFVPVIEAIGTRAGVPGGKSMSITGSATLRGSPSLGATCMRKPGAAFTSQIAPPVTFHDSLMSLVRKSTPAMSRPMALAARTAMSRLSGCTWSVMSVAVPPVDRLPVERKYRISPSGSTESVR